VLAFVASVSITFVNTLPATFTLDAGGVLNVLLFGATVLALSWFAPILASEVVQGQPHLAGPAIAGGAAVTTVLGYAGGRAVVSGATSLASAGARMIGGKSGGRRFSGGGAGGGAKGAGRPAIDYAGMKPPPPPPPATPPSGGSKT
jgi:type IV secretion system protein TrbL